LAEVINKNSNKTGVRASWQVLTTGSAEVKAGNITSLTINGVKIGTIKDIKNNDSDGKLVAAINAVKDPVGNRWLLEKT
jgi:flagellin